MLATVQIGVSMGVTLVWQLTMGADNSSATPLIIASALSSVGVIALFLATRWAEVSNHYLRTRPWGVITWCVLAAIGTIIPSIWVQEQLPELPNLAEAQFEELMANRWGYLAIGILAPLVEELVFRGAILRSLLAWRNKPWAMIAISALFFALIHMNPAQMPHAFIVGLLLGWMYWRTGSIIPGVVFHWVNNSVAYILYNVLANPDAPLVFHFNGSDRAVGFALLCSLCILIPSLYQLHLRMKKE